LKEGDLDLSAIVTESIHWEEGSTSTPRQGEILPACLVPILPEEFGVDRGPMTIECEERDLITLTQSCDLRDSEEAGLLALCPILSTRALEEKDRKFARKGFWEEVRKKRHEGLYLLEPLPGDSSPLMVDFREIISLSARYVRKRAATLGTRHRLKSPFREDFSSAFGAFYSRVALPRPGEKG
jgi:hypothetical protein